MSTRGNDAIVSCTAEIDGVEMHYLTGGGGPPLVLLHGYAESSRMWQRVLPMFAEKYRVIAPDLPGIGDSEIPADGLDMLTAGIRVHALVQSVASEPARVAGHDIGLMGAYPYA